MERLLDEFDDYLATVAEMLEVEGMQEALEILRSASARVEETGWDNWNGGTAIWTVYLQIDAKEYARVSSKKEVLEKQISERLSSVLGQFTDDWYGVEIRPLVASEKRNWRSASAEIAPETRRNIFDGLRLEAVNWHGELNEVEFLGRLYNLEQLPSTDNRFSDAAGDIWQHCINNYDWEDDWIYDDARFNLINAPTREFLRFLCEVVHPVVRPDRNESLSLVNHINDQLRSEGWSLVEQEKIAGRPRFAPMRRNALEGRSLVRAKTVSDALNAAWMQKEIERLENSIEKDPALAIGTAKELVETCCKTILARRGVSVSKSSDLPTLTKELAKVLQLVPEGISDQSRGADTIRLILRNLSALTQYLAELRGLYGSGHGRDGQHRGLQARHARLAVGAAVAFIDFVTETHHVRPLANSGEKDEGSSIQNS